MAIDKLLKMCKNTELKSFFKILQKEESIKIIMSKISLRVKIVTLVFFIVFLGFWAYINKSEIYTVLYNWKLIPIKEKFTELYLNDHLNLPKKITANETISFSFAIHNLEGENKDYPYTVYLKTSDERIILIEQMTVSVAVDEIKNVNVSYVSAETMSEGMVVVDLNGMNQSIDFLINNIN